MRNSWGWLLIVVFAMVGSAVAFAWAAVASGRAFAVHPRVPADARYVATNMESAAGVDAEWCGCGNDFQLFRSAGGGADSIKSAKPLKETSAVVEARCPFTLAEIRPVPYRLQLVGFALEPEGCIGMFEVEGSHALVMARAGRCLDANGLEIVSLATERGREGLVALAEVRDVRSGERVVLKSTTKTFTNARRAVIVMTGNPKPLMLPEGGKITAGGQTWAIESIGADTMSVVLDSESGVLAPMRKMLGLISPKEVKKKTNIYP